MTTSSERTEGSTGTHVPVSAPSPHTADVLTDVVLERHRQIRLWGHNEHTPNGTGPDDMWLTPYTFSGAAAVEETLRLDYDQHIGERTFMHYLREEFAEAMKCDDPTELYAELTQVAAVAVSWCEKLRARRGPQGA